MHRTMRRVETCSSAAGRMAVLWMVLAGATFGCAGSRESPFTNREDSTVRVQIDNRGFEDATVHAIWAGRRLRLGTVTATMSANYTLPVGSSVLLHFEIDLLAGPECITDQIWADPGDIIVLEVDRRYFRGGNC